MNEKKKLRRLPKRILSFVLSLAMVLTLMPGMSMEAYAAEPAGRGESWDILYSEVRANGSGKAYPVGTRIYMDIKPRLQDNEYDFLYMESYDAAVSLGYVSGTYDSNLRRHFFEQRVALHSVLTLQEKYECSVGSPLCSCENKPVKSGGYWIFNLDNGLGDKFYGVASSGNGGSIPVGDLDIPIEVKPEEEPTSTKKITSMNLNVDWSKIPTLTVGESAPRLSVSAVTASGTGVSKIEECVWAVKAPNGDWVPTRNFTINDTDTYACFICLGASEGYCFAEESGVDLKDIVTITSNVNVAQILSDGNGSSALAFLKLGTVSEIAAAKGEATTIKAQSFTLTHNLDGTYTVTGVTVPKDHYLYAGVANREIFEKNYDGNPLNFYDFWLRRFNSSINNNPPYYFGLNTDFEVVEISPGTSFSFTENGVPDAGIFISVAKKYDENKHIYPALTLGMTPNPAVGESLNNRLDATRIQITSMNLNVDWSKIPTLKVGQSAPNFEGYPVTASGTGVFGINDCGWAVKALATHVDSEYISQKVYESYKIYDHWVPLNEYKNYTINATDNYACFIGSFASGGYCFAEENGVHLENIVASNVNVAQILSGYDGSSAVAFLKLGTVSEIEDAKKEATTTKHTIKATAGANGSISPNGEVQVKEGENQTFTITPNAGYEIDTLTVDGAAVTASSSYTFSDVTAAHTIDVTFKQVSSTPDSGVHTHTIVTDAAVAPTCTEAGKTEGKHCSVCGEIITAQTTVAALGHDWSGEWVITKLATATTEGKKECTCKREGCNQKKYEVIPVIGTPADPNEGKLDKDAEVAPEAPIEEATLDNTKTELLSAPAIFTAEEKQAIDNGADARVWMEVSKTDESSIPSADKTKISDAATSIMGENPTITYFDADLFKQVGDGAATQLHEPGIDIEVTIKVPETLRNADSSFEREYKIIRLHTDVVTGASLVDILSGTFDKITGEFKFKTDKFSTYAIAYTDKKLVTGVTLTPETATLTQAGQSVQLTATVAPADAANKKVTWTTSDSRVAAVDENGKVTAVGNGTCTITATTEDGAKTAECKITVNIPSQPDTPVQPDTPDQPDTPVQPDTPDQPDTPVQPDTPGTTVTVTKEQKEKNALALNAKLKVSQTKSQLDIVWGEVSGADGYNVYAAYCGTKFTKKSLNQVKSGKITKLIVKKINGKKLNLKKNYKIYVEAYKLVDGKQVILGKTITAHIVGRQNTAYTNVKDIKLKKTSLPLKKGKTATIQAEAVLVDKSKKQLTDAHTKEFRYVTSNKKVATVSSEGKIKAVGKGTCTIYVYARNGYAKKVKVTVK